ncbi:phospho-sugar mutase [Angustibacter sp. McL0619]|uniref:phospho-sugar mutase n=1 Tax=Angustibacter sp. McL0619 TaxID=3415676 RepID=UPI003CF1A3A9
MDDALLDIARSWRDDDPDPRTRAELEVVLDAATSGDATALADLADRFDGTLEFGTAGLRGAVGAGSNRMNRSVVIRAAAGLTAYLQHDLSEPRPEPRVVIGFDARHRSDDFARDTAAVVTAAGGEAFVLPRPLPTPVLAFAIRYLGVDAGVMVTASHNPPQDNGYKVYLGDGSQIVPPADAQIAARIAAVAAVSDVPLADDGWVALGDDVLDAYLEAAAAVVGPHSPRDLSVVHTPLHGVGRDVLVAALERAGFPAPYVVTSQGDPDPDFPTVAFPNPEEPGAIDAALDAARERGADIVLANDPDADRCAVAVPDPAAAGGWRMLTGDEVGVLLGAWLVHGWSKGAGIPDDAVMACSIVSGRQLAAVCAVHGLRHVETLTGFKWISRVPGLSYGYEEALGYCVDPQAVRDKDGVSAALLMAELAATLKAHGRTVLDELDDIARETGVHLTGQHSVRVADLSLIADAMARLRAEPLAELAGSAVDRVDDLSAGVGDLPPTDGLRYYLADGSRVIVRPSGTEPKLKAYLEVVEPVAAGDDAVRVARSVAAGRLSALSSAVAEVIGL